MQVFIRNHGDPRPGRSPGPFRLDGWIRETPLGERLEIDDGMLGYMSRPLGEQSALQFGIFVTGLYNKPSYDRAWLTLEDADGNVLGQDSDVAVKQVTQDTTDQGVSDDTPPQDITGTSE